MPFPPPGALPGPGIEPKSPALAGGFFTTEPPGKPLGREDPLEKKTAAYSSILAWEIPCIEEPGGLQISFLVSKGVRLSDQTIAYIVGHVRVT